MHYLFNHTICVSNAGVIRMYRLRVISLDQSATERIYTTSSRIELVNDLQCCTTYEYSISAYTIAYGQPTSTRNILKTLPNIVSSMLVIIIIIVVYI